MNLLTLPLRHAGTRPLRVVLLVAVFTLGIAAMTALHQVSELVGETIEKKLLSFGANILVTPKRETLKVSYGGYTLGDVTVEEGRIVLPEAYAAINAMPLRANVAVVAPKLLSAARLPEGPAALVGVDWKEEPALKAYWAVDGKLPDEHSVDEVLAGATLAQSRKLAPGQRLTLDGHALVVSGVLQATGGDDDNALFAPLALVQSMTGKKDQAGFLEVAALCAGCPIDDIVAQLQTALPHTEVRALRQVAQSRMYAIHFAQNLAFSVSLVILITACAMIVMSMLSAVNERKKEIGIMRAVGFSRTGVFAAFTVEAAGIGMLSGLLGYASGLLLAEQVLRRLPLADASGAAPVFQIAALLLSGLAVAGIAALAAAFPAWKASRVEPAEALVAL